MKSHLLCIPCTVRAAYDIAVKATEDEALQKRIIYETLRWLSGDPSVMEMTPAGLHTYVQRLTCRITGNPDPFKDLKRRSNEVAMRVLPVLERRCRRMNCEDAFRLAVLGTICGNTIDFEVEGHKVSMDGLERQLLGCLDGSLAIDDTHELMNLLSRSETLLYLTDNSGEIVFDRFLMSMIREMYQVEILAAVKGGPVLNDATMEDAEQIRLGEVAEVITTGSDHIGVNLEEASEEFQQSLREADLIIAKGQGNYESITEIHHLLRRPIAYVLRAKCILVAESLGVKQFSNVVKIIT
ncbi:MAG: hypothetical protein AYL33_004950 [Candidatus Bathyarchaeota archaeon B63]|nr:MAG: hypothetical protein AYL33_004950 [Candidatus Bathyarchaeota archaeon B63]